jgi:hypothetical protein
LPLLALAAGLAVARRRRSAPSRAGGAAAVAVAVVALAAGLARAEEGGAAPTPSPAPDLFAEVRHALVSVELDRTPLDRAVERIGIAAGVGIRLTDALAPRAREILVTIRVKDVPLARVLDALAATYGLTWRVGRGAVQVDAAPTSPSPTPPTR